jgi:hypothetical protein
VHTHMSTCEEANKLDQNNMRYARSDILKHFGWLKTQSQFPFFNAQLLQDISGSGGGGHLS